MKIFIMKIFIAAAVVGLALWPLCSFPAFAQWNYNQNVIDNMIEHRIDTRKMRARMKARKNRQKPSRRRSVNKVARRQTVARKRVAATLPHHDVHIERDTYQDFHMKDSDGYVVNFNFAPTTGKAKPITKTYRYSYMNNHEVAAYNDLPPATYIIKAYAVYQGKKYPVHLGTTYGTPTDPTGGNFGPSVQMEVKAAKDFYGHMAVQGFPETIYLRVIE